MKIMLKMLTTIKYIFVLWPQSIFSIISFLTRVMSRLKRNVIYLDY